MTTPELSPRKRHLQRHIDHLICSLNKKKKDVKRLQDKSRLQKKRIVQLKDILRILADKSYITEENEALLDSIGVENKELLKRQIQKSKTGLVPKTKYSPELRSFALTLHF